MSHQVHCRMLLFCYCLACCGVVSAEEAAENERLTPTLKFFYFDQRQTEWVVSSEPDRLQQHLQQNADSTTLYASLQDAVQPLGDTQRVRSAMSNWLETERARFGSAGSRNTLRIRVAEGVTAYMRAHDFEISRLMQALLSRSGAEDVELAAIHLIDGAGKSAYKLKVMLPSDDIGIDKQGFDVVLQSSEISYASVAYALAIALYQVHEIINAEQTDNAVPNEIPEQLPVPEALPLPADVSTSRPLPALPPSTVPRSSL